MLIDRSKEKLFIFIKQQEILKRNKEQCIRSVFFYLSTEFSRMTGEDDFKVSKTVHIGKDFQ